MVVGELLHDDGARKELLPEVGPHPDGDRAEPIPGERVANALEVGHAVVYLLHRDPTLFRKAELLGLLLLVDAVLSVLVDVVVVGAVPEDLGHRLGDLFDDLLHDLGDVGDERCELLGEGVDVAELEGGIGVGEQAKRLDGVARGTVPGVVLGLCGAVLVLVAVFVLFFGEGKKNRFVVA